MFKYTKVNAQVLKKFNDTHSINEQFDLCNGFTVVIFGLTTIWTELCIMSNKEVNPLSEIRHSAEY